MTSFNRNATASSDTTFSRKMLQNWIIIELAFPTTTVGVCHLLSSINLFKLCSSFLVALCQIGKKCIWCCLYDPLQNCVQWSCSPSKMVEKLEIFDNRLLQTSMEEINLFQNVSVDPVNYPRWQPLLKMPFFPLSIISNFWYLIQLIYIFWNNIDIFKTSSEPLNEMKQNLNTSILRWPLPILCLFSPPHSNIC